MGVTVTATEAIGGSDAVYEIDPYEDLGIEEAEIPTILLSEAATAREALDLLLGIYDTAGCCGGSGLFIADNTETWYVENVTGHQYVALKLNGSLAFTVPNISVISLIDLDGTENVIASEGIISVAKEASTYVGDEEANTIDYVASYNADQTANSRMVDALKYFNAETATDGPANDAYTISNVDAEGNIVPLYTGIALDHAYSVEGIVGFYDISDIGSSRNLETHIFQIFAEDGPTDTVEWVAMNNASMSAFVPYYSPTRGQTSPFTGMIRCTLCGKNYRRKTTHGRYCWQCGTFLTFGKKYCHTKQIPEDILMATTASVLGMAEFDEENFRSQIERIEVPAFNHLVYHAYHRCKKNRCPLAYQQNNGQNTGCPKDWQHSKTFPAHPIPRRRYHTRHTAADNRNKNFPYAP